MKTDYNDKLFTLYRITIERHNRAKQKQIPNLFKLYRKTIELKHAWRYNKKEKESK